MPTDIRVIPMSIVTFETNTSNDEVFLLYSEGFEKGPGINRDGKGEPWMQDRNNPARQIAHPIEQRRGTWLIDAKEAKMLEIELIEKNQYIDDRTRERWRHELDETPNYFDAFKDRYPNYKVVGMQGCGNLTMNEWFIAYLKSEFTHFDPRFLYRFGEDFSTRIYTCLVKWKDNRSENSRLYTIDDLKFNLLTNEVNRAKDSYLRGVTDQIEFAVFGQKIVEDGQIVDFSRIATQFEDIRHLYKLPNINHPKEFPTKLKQDDGSVIDVVQYKRPRMLFGEMRNHDVWFGERQMTQREYVDLLTHALTEPVILNREFENMGADWGLIETAFQETGYRRIQDESYTPRSRGEWRRYSHSQVQIFLQRNVYAYTMLGLKDNGDIIASAAGGLAGRTGQTLEAMAQNMVSAGSRQVLLIDEGDDVFQWVNGQYIISPRRGRIRAVFVFAQKVETS